MITNKAKTIQLVNNYINIDDQWQYPMDFEWLCTDVDEVYNMNGFKDNDTLVSKWRSLVHKYGSMEWFLYQFKDRFKEDEELDPSHARLIGLKTLIMQIKEIQDGIFSLWSIINLIE